MHPLRELLTMHGSPSCASPTPARAHSGLSPLPSSKQEFPKQEDDVTLGDISILTYSPHASPCILPSAADEPITFDAEGAWEFQLMLVLGKTT